MKNNNLQQTQRINLTIFFCHLVTYNASYFLHLIENIFMYYARLYIVVTYRYCTFVCIST